MGSQLENENDRLLTGSDLVSVLLNPNATSKEKTAALQHLELALLALENDLDNW